MDIEVCVQCSYRSFFLYFLILFSPFLAPCLWEGSIPFCPNRLVHVLLPFQINGVAIIVMAKNLYEILCIEGFWCIHLVSGVEIITCHY